MVGREGDQTADRHLSLDHKIPTVERGQRPAEEGGRGGYSAPQVREHLEAGDNVNELFPQDCEPAQLHPLSGKQFDELDGGERLHQKRGDLSVKLTHLAGLVDHDRSDLTHPIDLQWHHHQADDKQLPVEPDEKPHCGHEDKHVGHEGKSRIGEHRLHLGDIGVEP